MGSSFGPSLTFAAILALGVAGVGINIEGPAQGIAAFAKSGNSANGGNSGNHGGGNSASSSQGGTHGQSGTRGHGSTNGQSASHNPAPGVDDGAGAPDDSDTGSGGVTGPVAHGANFGKLNAVLHMSDRAKAKNSLYLRVQKAMEDLYATNIALGPLPEDDQLSPLQTEKFAALQATFNKPLTNKVWAALQKEFLPPTPVAPPVTAPDDDADTETPAPPVE